MARESMEYDVLIVGAGPAGLSAAIRLKQLAAERSHEVSVCVIEKGSEKTYDIKLGELPAQREAKADAQDNAEGGNDGGKLADIAADSGACPDSLHSARNVGVLDYDNDGRLDLLVIEDKFTPRPRTTLFRNDGKLKFSDVTAKVGLPENVFGLGYAAPAGSSPTARVAGRIEARSTDGRRSDQRRR